MGVGVYTMSHADTMKHTDVNTRSHADAMKHTDVNTMTHADTMKHTDVNTMSHADAMKHTDVNTMTHWAYFVTSDIFDRFRFGELTGGKGSSVFVSSVALKALSI